MRRRHCAPWGRDSVFTLLGRGEGVDAIVDFLVEQDGLVVPATS